MTRLFYLLRPAGRTHLGVKVSYEPTGGIVSRTARVASAVKDVKYIGTDTVNGLPCQEYTYTMDMDVSGQKWAGTGKAWIGSTDRLPHQLDSEMTVSSYKQKSHITYEYNVDFKVEKPM